MPDEPPVYERPGQQLGSAWTQRARPCANCGHEHHALIHWTGGTALCVACSRIREKNIRIALAAKNHNERGPDARFRKRFFDLWT